MGVTESLSNYPCYCKSSLVTHILSGKFDCSFKIAQGLTYCQAEFQHSDLGGSTNEVHILMLFTPPNILIHLGPSSEVSK